MRVPPFLGFLTEFMCVSVSPKAGNLAATKILPISTLHDWKNDHLSLSLSFAICKTGIKMTSNWAVVSWL